MKTTSSHDSDISNRKQKISLESPSSVLLSDPEAEIVNRSGGRKPLLWRLAGAPSVSVAYGLACMRITGNSISYRGAHKRYAG
jgi:hypothetical protein